MNNVVWVLTRVDHDTTLILGIFCNQAVARDAMYKMAIEEGYRGVVDNHSTAVSVNGFTYLIDDSPVFTNADMTLNES